MNGRSLTRSRPAGAFVEQALLTVEAAAGSALDGIAGHATGAAAKAQK